MASSTIPRSAADYYGRQQHILVLLLAALRQVWRRMDPKARWEEQYADDGIGAQLLMLVAAAQVAAARDADGYIAAVLAELGLVPGASPGIVVPSAFSGVAGDGRDLASLLGYAVPKAGQAFNAARDVSVAAEELERPEWASDVLWESLERERLAQLETDQARNMAAAAGQALAEAGNWLETVAATAVIDAARSAESAAIAVHPEVTGYVRMLNPPSCSRCVLLAGQFYRWNDGFKRHPLCDCRHIPASESVAGDLTVEPDAFFASLPTAAELSELHPGLTVRERRKAGHISQEDIFTTHGAAALRLGADIGQVVNARRGMDVAQVGGRDVIITRESTTRRGIASRRRTGRRMEARLMPETILTVAADRDDAIRMLQLHGFILRS